MGVANIPQATAVLVVDDDPDIGEVLSDWLTHEGYAVHLVSTGMEAIARARDQRVAAVILDLGLPDRDGLFVLQALKEKEVGLPVIILTASAEAGKASEALRYGAYAYFTKPYSQAELKATLSRAVRT